MSMSDIKSVARAFITRFPALQEKRFDMQRRISRALRRPVENDFRALALVTLKPGEQLVDVGANRGLSMDAMRLYQPNADIIAFEPNPYLAKKLAAAFSSDKRVLVENRALGEQEGHFRLHVPFYRDYMFDGLASFKREEAVNWLNSDRLKGFDPTLLTVKELECKVSRLDDCALRPGFVKIDVQGFEHEVIRGGLETLTRHEPIVLMENNDPSRDPGDLLARGWKSFAFMDGRFVPGQVGHLNTFYMTDARISASVTTLQL